VASKFARPKAPRLPCLGGYARGLPQMPSQMDMIIKLEEILQSIWDSLHQELIDKAVKEFRRILKAYVASWSGY